jgi:tripartite-type tricarboxylate transporter receptor subunit TctC
MTDLISGQLTMVVPAVTRQVLEFHRSGKMRVLAVTSPKRLTAAPELPTAAEAGLPRLTVTATLGLLAPAGTPSPIIGQIAQATGNALADSAYQRILIETGFDPILDSSPEKFRQSLAADVALWTPVVKALALKID